MINFYFLQSLNYSIAVAVIIGLIRFRQIYRAYQPFIFILFASLICEVISTALILSNKGNAAVTNIFVLIECLLWFWQFKKWDGFIRRKWQFGLLMGLILVIWGFENLVMNKIYTFSSVYAIISSFCIVFLAINQVNLLIVQEKMNLLVNSKFLICTGLLIFYTYKLMVESFYVFNLNQSNDFLAKIYYILVFMNVFVNLLFALATLWIPTRQRFTMLS